MTRDYGWRPRQDGERTAPYLARVLDELGPHFAQLAANARALHYDDYFCPPDVDDGANIHRLVADLRARDEYLAWAKERALAELEPGGGGVSYAVASVQSDLTKHPDTRDHSAILLMSMLAFAGQLCTAREVREFLDGIL